MKFSHMVFGAASLLACFGVPAHSAGLPNGASSLKETYDDWQMVCRAVNPNYSSAISDRVIASRFGPRLAGDLCSDFQVLKGW